jgi:hypothetical protein
MPNNNVDNTTGLSAVAITPLSSLANNGQFLGEIKIIYTNYEAHAGCYLWAFLLGNRGKFVYQI